MKCPNCGLENPPSASRCNCGYDFSKGAAPKKSLEEQAKVMREDHEKEVRKLTEHKPEGTTLKKRSVLLMILFTVLTFGLYVPIWFLTSRQALNSLTTRKKINLWLCIGLLVTHLLFLFVWPALRWAEVILLLVLSFRVKFIFAVGGGNPTASVKFPGEVHLG